MKDMSTHSRSTPYSDLPDHCFWSRSHRNRPMGEVDPVIRGAFTLHPDMRIATAGSCFAQHIARHLKDRGYNYLVTEPAHPVIAPDLAAAFNYGTFTARYGNLYTARQLLQLVQRATGTFTPTEDVWEDERGRLIDPFRPAIQPGGFSSRAEFESDRQAHFAAVRAMLKQADVFVFTFGLTESWRSRVDGAVFPLAPGVAGGTFDPACHEFVNFTVTDTVDDFIAFTKILRGLNPAVKILMTVSPVPLMATARSDESVVSATSYSKSVLRVACEELRTCVADCHYFQSYEVITGLSSRGAYYASDLREVTPAGVAHVMDLFMRHYTDSDAGRTSLDRPGTPRGGDHRSSVEAALDVICDEELIDRAAPRTSARSGLHTDLGGKNGYPAGSRRSRMRTGLQRRLRRLDGWLTTHHPAARRLLEKTARRTHRLLLSGKSPRR